MSELTLRQLEGINASLSRRQRQREIQRRDQCLRDCFIASAVIAIITLFLGIWLLIESEFIPGDQEAILKAYKATRHEAVEVAWR